MSMVLGGCWFNEAHHDFEEQVVHAAPSGRRTGDLVVPHRRLRCCKEGICSRAAEIGRLSAAFSADMWRQACVPRVTDLLKYDSNLN